MSHGTTWPLLGRLVNMVDSNSTGSVAVAVAITVAVLFVAYFVASYCLYTKQRGNFMI